MMQVIRTLGASLLVVSLGGCVAGEAGPTASPSSAPVLAVQPPSDLPHLQLPVRGELTVSRNNCFALTFKNSVLYAPAGSTVTGDGQGVNIGGEEYRLGDSFPLTLSASVIPLADVREPSQQLLDCKPEMVAVVSLN
ncbi:MAG: hypothetical protein H6524_12930 [Actinobacteria bacterium]|jgi:hypothetical protein|nr:hypothetical protein [Micrococcales bacterium]MCB9429705.1 hypothetical protein [Actinomycetota bacterium]HRV66135.1 hypothetical protein [Candidatus Nanopelagicales bacterium]HPE12499.1 hypothetical protein [Actinomycetota bacterium]HPJ19937.1 hypothetical protein [Actinomycetota bacterium]